MKDFFTVADLPQVLAMRDTLPSVQVEEVRLFESMGRVLAEEITADEDLPPFPRSTMDGYAVRAADTFGASESNPAYLGIVGEVEMGVAPEFSVMSGQTAGVPTGGMLPRGADSVVMVEHSALIDAQTLEIHRSVAPGQNMVAAGEDFPKGRVILPVGSRLRPQEMGLLAALGKERLLVFRRPVIGIISTGDELVPVDRAPREGEIRDTNTYTLSGFVQAAGGLPLAFGIVKDHSLTLVRTIRSALEQSDMVILSGGSSVGMRDLTIQSISSLPDSRIRVHGIAISPGKPTILGVVGEKMVWGLPGHVVSAMIVFQMIVRPFVEKLGGLSTAQERRFPIYAALSRNIASAQGRVDFVRVRLMEKEGRVLADPVQGKSALMNTMIRADGLVVIGRDREGLEKGTVVGVIPI
ncbi:MAG: gephyrin-like molybdotransferase Glp [Thermodesulfobacteriota bacterium]